MFAPEFTSLSYDLDDTPALVPPVSMMPSPIITLTTDFGVDSHYVAQMKGSILSINPDAMIVDISHGIPPQDIRQGALALAEATTIFPERTIHVAVVDPGVGTERQIVFAEIGKQIYIAPDNGLLSLVYETKTNIKLIRLVNDEYWRTPVSSTFHGRDIMAPVAAHLSLGVQPEQLGSPLDRINKIQWTTAKAKDRTISGMIVSFDSFGNLITDVTLQLLKPALPHDTVTITFNGNVVHGLETTYGSAPDSALIALIGSSGLLELAMVNGNAAKRCGATIGDEVVVSW